MLVHDASRGDSCIKAPRTEVTKWTHAQDAVTCPVCKGGSA